MKKYKLLGDIMLTFIHNNDSQSYTIGPQDGGVLESDGVTVWYIAPDGKKYESITTANIIDVSLENNKIEEVKNHES